MEDRHLGMHYIAYSSDL